jgi:zinc/manganese transport system substrate-binding protein
LPTRRHVLSVAAASGSLAILPGAFPGWAQDGTRIRAIATFSILGDFVGNVGGERLKLTTLVGPNGDVHVYEPTPADVKAVAAADGVFVNGLGLEGWLDRLIAASATHARIVVASQGVPPRNAVNARDRGGNDPHAWQSVANAKIYVANIRDGLIAVDPAGKTFYQTNAVTYLATLDALDAEVKMSIERIPADRRKIITAHEAFGYFGDAYGVEFRAPEGLSTDTEPSAGSVAKLIDQIRREKIPAVFMENVADPRVIQRVAEETGAKIGGALYSDALSPPGGPAGTYIAMMRSNVRALGRALTS